VGVKLRSDGGDTIGDKGETKLIETEGYKGKGPDQWRR